MYSNTATNYVHIGCDHKLRLIKFNNIRSFIADQLQLFHSLEK